MVLVGLRADRAVCDSLFYTMREARAPRWLFRLALLALPLPWIGVELGWFVAEFGRQPWIIEGVLPTFLATSELGVSRSPDHHCRLHRPLRHACRHRGDADGPGDRRKAPIR